MTRQKNEKTCPHCGMPVQEKPGKFRLGLLILVGAVGFFLTGMYSWISFTNASEKSADKTVNKKAAIVYSNLRYAHTRLNIRQGPGKSYKIIGKINQGGVVEIKGTENQWAKVSMSGTRMGYIFEPLLRTEPMPPE